MKTFFATIALLVSATTFAATTGKTQVIWHGHAAFEIRTPQGHVLLIDPWLKNPAAPKDQDPVAKLAKADYILLTHGHFDHVGESVEIAKKTKARLVTNFELGSQMAKLLGYPADQMGFDTLINIGGQIKIAGDEVTVSMVPAIHSSGISKGEGQDIAYGGNPAGFVVAIKDGPTIYHSGDTAYFSDMKLIGEQHHPDLALINIGGHFGMEPKQAIQAARAVNARTVVPMHFKSFPILTQDPAEFIKGVGSGGLVMTVGQAIEFDGKKLSKK